MDIRLWAPVATCMAIIVSTYLWYLNRKKALSYNILRRAPLLNLKGAASNDLDVRFGGHSVLDAYLIVVRVFNSGHLSINLSDYQSNISLMLNPGAHILAASVIESVPADLSERVKDATSKPKPLIDLVDKDRVSLTPVLLNEGDSITVQILARNAAGEIKVRGHLHGIKEIHIWHESRLVSKIFIQLGALIMAFAMLGVQPSDLISCRFEHVLPWILIFMVGFVFLQAGIYWPSNGENRDLMGLGYLSS